MTLKDFALGYTHVGMGMTQTTVMTIINPAPCHLCCQPLPLSPHHPLFLA